MLLTAMCVLYDKGGRLPEDRYELYKSIVDGVLHSRYPGDAREREPVLRRLEAIAYGMHTGEPGDAPRETPAAEISWVETERLLADFAKKNPSLGQGEVDAAVQREELLTRSGLLLPRPNERAAFYHLSFQEFLAAQRIVARQRQTGDQVIDARWTVPEWRPTLLFLFAAQIFNKDARVGARPARAAARRPGPRRGQGQPGAGGVHRRGARAVPGQALSDPRGPGRELPPAQPGRHRGRGRGAGAADARPVPGPAGRPAHLRSARSPRLRRGAGRDLSLWREKGKTVEIAAPFLLGRYPVTNSQYQAFMDDGGYSDRKWWSDAGWSLATEGRGHRARLLARPALERSQPAGGRRQLLGGRGLLRLGGRAPAARAGMGGRRPRPGGLRVPVGRRLGGRDLQHPGGRARRHLAGRALSPLPPSPTGPRGSGRQRLGVVCDHLRRSTAKIGPRAARRVLATSRDYARCANRDGYDPDGSGRRRRFSCGVFVPIRTD